MFDECSLHNWQDCMYIRVCMTQSLTLAAHAQRRVIVVGLCVGLSFSPSVCPHVFSRTVAVVDTKRGYVCMLGTARVWSGVVEKQHFYGGGYIQLLY